MSRNPTRLRVAAPALAAMAALLALTPLLLSRGSAHAASATPILAAAGHSVHREWPRLSADPARDSADALTAPQLVSPAEGQTNVSLTPTLAWNAAAGATSYTAYIWDPAAVVLVWQATTGALSAGVPAGNALQRGRFYYYSVVSCNASSCSNYARWLGFTTRSTLQTPQLSAPTEGATSVSITPTLRCRAVAEAAHPSGGAASSLLRLPAQTKPTVSFNPNGRGSRPSRAGAPPNDRLSRPHGDAAAARNGRPPRHTDSRSTPNIRAATPSAGRVAAGSPRWAARAAPRWARRPCRAACPPSPDWRESERRSCRRDHPSSRRTLPGRSRAPSVRRGCSSRR